MTDEWKIADRTFRSRLILGSARYPNNEVMLEAIKASGAEMVTVAIRRIPLQEVYQGGILHDLKAAGVAILPNTAGCYTAQQAIDTAHLAREALGTEWIKLEVIGDPLTLFPDIPELLVATQELIREGFVVLPYCNDDPVTCRKLADMGCAAVMPLGAPIGSGMGLCNVHNMRIIREQIDIPLIVDAGVGTASDVAIAMELGCDGVLLNTAIAQAREPVLMARAMRAACEAGRYAHLSGRIPRRLYATASSPLEGVPV